jgi:hypothetical protein
MYIFHYNYVADHYLRGHQLSKIHVSIRGVGYIDVVEALFLYRNATKIVLPLFDIKKIFHTSKY